MLSIKFGLLASGCNLLIVECCLFPCVLDLLSVEFCLLPGVCCLLSFELYLSLPVLVSQIQLKHTSLGICTHINGFQINCCLLKVPCYMLVKVWCLLSGVLYLFSLV